MTEEWTFNTHHLWAESRFTALEKYFADLLAERKSGDKEKDELRQKAIEAALASINLRLESMNEFRLALTKQQETLATKEGMEFQRKAFDQQMTLVNQQISTINQALATITGNKTGGEKNTVLVFGIIAAIATLIGIIGIASRFLN